MVKVTRLPKTSVIKVIKEGKNIQSPLFNLKFSKNTLCLNRFSVVVSKKELKNAVERNKVKRVLREVVRKTLADTEDFFDVVCFAKKEVLQTRFSDLLGLFDTVKNKLK